MVISAYQTNNVLRVYGEQLRRGRTSNRHRSIDTNSPDKITEGAGSFSPKSLNIAEWMIFF